MIIKDGVVTYSWFEVEMLNILTNDRRFDKTTEIFHERKALWDEVQRLKKLAREESPEMAGEEDDRENIA